MGFRSPAVEDFPHDLLSAIHSDTVPGSPVLGDLIVGNSTPAWDRLGIGAEAQILTVFGGQPSWQDLPTTAAAAYFFYDTAADVATYKYMQQTPSPDVETSVSAVVNAADTHIQDWITPAGLPGVTFIPSGVWLTHVHFARTAGSQGVQVYAKVYKRNLAGTETLIGTSEETSVSTSAVPAEEDVHFASSDVNLLATDRLVIKFYANPAGVGSAPTVTLYYRGDDASRLQFPVAVSSLSHHTLLDLTTYDDHTQYALLAGRSGTNDFTGRITADSLHVGGTAAPGDNNLTVDGVIGVGVAATAGVDVLASNTRDAAPVEFQAKNASTDAGGGTQARLVLKNSAKECQIVLTSVNADSLGIGTTGYMFYYFDGTGPFVYYLNGSVRLTIQAGVHVGGTSDPGDNNLTADGTINAGTTLQVGGKSFVFGANDSAGAGYRTVTIENA